LTPIRAVGQVTGIRLPGRGVRTGGDQVKGAPYAAGRVAVGADVDQPVGVLQQGRRLSPCLARGATAKIDLFTQRG
jgi:hypothetical protein